MVMGAKAWVVGVFFDAVIASRISEVTEKEIHVYILNHVCTHIYK